MSGSKYTLDELLEIGRQHAPDSSNATNLARDEAAGTATYRLPPIVIRRTLELRVSPAAAFVKEEEIHAVEIMSTERGSGGEDRKTTTRNLLKSRYGAGSNAETDRRIYEVAALLLGLE